MTLALSIIALPLGVFLIVYGGYDDSPGAQLIGFFVILAGVYGLYKRWKKNRSSSS